MFRLRPYKKCDAKHIVMWCKDEDTFFQRITAINMLDLTKLQCIRMNML
jgi:hypothetical protein